MKNKTNHRDTETQRGHWPVILCVSASLWFNSMFKTFVRLCWTLCVSSAAIAGQAASQPAISTAPADEERTLKIKWDRHFEEFRHEFYQSPEGEYERVPDAVRAAFEQARKNVAAEIAKLEAEHEDLAKQIREYRQETREDREKARKARDVAVKDATRQYFKNQTSNIQADRKARASKEAERDAELYRAAVAPLAVKQREVRKQIDAIRKYAMPACYGPPPERFWPKGIDLVKFASGMDDASFRLFLRSRGLTDERFVTIVESNKNQDRRNYHNTMVEELDRTIYASSASRPARIDPKERRP